MKPKVFHLQVNGSKPTYDEEWVGGHDGVDDSLTPVLSGKGIHFSANFFNGKFCFSTGEVTKAQKANSLLSPD